MALRNLARNRVVQGLALLIIAGLFLVTAGRLLASPHVGVVPGCDPSPQEVQAVNASVAAAAAKAAGLAGRAHYDWRVQSICRQGDWAYTFVQGYASDTGAPLPGPSEVALSHQTASGWQSVLPSDGPAYEQMLAALPGAMLPPEARPLLGQPAAGAGPAPSGPAAAFFSGFSLPFPAGQIAYVHWHWYPALDFTITDPGTVRAAKEGTAVFVKGDSTVECGNPPPNWTCWMYANAIVIQSGPNEYAWYMHFAPNTIPEWIHEGVHIPAGADIGTQGMTGWASSPHLHFQVSSWYSCCTGTGAARFPAWPFSTILPVDFNEYAWGQIPYTVVSQNGNPLPTNPPPSPTAPPAPAPAANHSPTAAPPAPTPNPPAPAPAAAGSPCSNPYTVQPGDYVIRIAANCNVNEAALIAANPGLNPNWIYAGQLLNLPAGQGSQPEATAVAPSAPQPTATEAAPSGGGRCSGTHVVVPGENLWLIGLSCGIGWQQLAAVNHIAFPFTIYPGQALQYP